MAQSRVDQVPMGRCRYCGEHCKKAIDDRRTYLQTSLAAWNKKAKTANFVDRKVAEQNAHQVKLQIDDLPCAPRPCQLKPREEASHYSSPTVTRNRFIASARKVIGA